MLKVQIIGHLGKDAEVNVHGSDSVINFSVAHTDKYKDGNGTMVNKTTWVSCSWWVERTTIAQYLKTGTQVYVEGVPEAKMWRGKDGDNKCGLNCRVYSVQLLGSKQSEGTVSRETNPPLEGSVNMPSVNNNPIEEDDLPF